jgi:aminoglycoside phosphotransferase (APT) family kinase protein
MPDPTDADAARILTTITGSRVRVLRRFPNGLAHFVYDAVLANGEQVVIRLTRATDRGEFAAAVYWHPQLVPLGVPLPRLLHAEIDPVPHGFPVLILERLPGVDLGDCYRGLSTAQKQGIAMRIVSMQGSVATLPAGPGFGYARSFDDPGLKPAWLDVLEASLARSRAQIHSAGVMSEEPVDRVAHAVEPFRTYLARVKPVCFLHDTTTKNVIVDHGELSGIVDVDSVCFGDPL